VTNVISHRQHLHLSGRIVARKTGVMTAGAADWPLRGLQRDPQEAIRCEGQRTWWSPNILNGVRGSSIGVEEEEREGRRLGWIVRLASWGAVAFSVWLPVMRLYDIAVLPAASGGLADRVVYAFVAVACYLPLQTWLVLSASRRVAGRRQLVALGALAGFMFAMVPVVGVGWVGILYVLAALALVVPPPPWSLLLFAALVATPAPLTLLLGHPDWAAYFTTGIIIFPVPLSVLVLLTRVVRELQGARLALAEQAVVRERLRIDTEVRESVGSGLAAIVAQGQRASATAARDPLATIAVMRTLVENARRTLVETRRIVTRYRQTTLRAELETVATLLSAAGIATQFESQADTPDAGDERDRAWLRREVARLIAETPPPSAVTLAITTHEGRARIQLRAVAVHQGLEVTAR
jgi:two-component system, NarL family, sensor histidine kinase DesK